MMGTPKNGDNHKFRLKEIDTNDSKNTFVRHKDLLFEMAKSQPFAIFALLLFEPSQAMMGTPKNGDKFRLRQWKESIRAIRVIRPIRGSDCGAIQDAKRAFCPQSMSWLKEIDTNDSKNTFVRHKDLLFEMAKSQPFAIFALLSLEPSQAMMGTPKNGDNHKFRLRQWKESIRAIRVIRPIRGSDCGAIQDAKRAFCPQSMSWIKEIDTNDSKNTFVRHKDLLFEMAKSQPFAIFALLLFEPSQTRQ